VKLNIKPKTDCLKCKFRCWCCEFYSDTCNRDKGECSSNNFKLIEDWHHCPNDGKRFANVPVFTKDFE
jgi:hypothetical protein